MKGMSMTFSRPLPNWATPLGGAVLACGLSAFVTLAFWGSPAASITNRSSDYLLFYEPVARALLAGEGFMQLDGAVTLEYPPGYPLVLAALFGSAQALGLPDGLLLRAANLVSLSLSAAVVWLLARQIAGPGPALGAALLWMTYPFILWLTLLPSSELPFLVALYGGVGLFWWAQLRPQPPGWRYGASGLLVGVAMLIRPIAIGLGVVLAGLLWCGRRDLAPRRRLGLAALLLLGNLVAVAPWEAWVYTQTGTVVPLSTAGPGVISVGLTFALRTEDRAYRQGVTLPAPVARVMGTLQARAEEMRTLGGVGTVLTEVARTDPWALLHLGAIKVARAWYGTESHRFETGTLLLQLVYLVLVLWGMQAAWAQGGQARHLSVGLGVIALYFWGMTTISVSLLRYMTPVMGLLCVPVAACWGSRRWRRADAPRRGPQHPAATEGTAARSWRAK
jgi:hypothetical protein